MRKFLFVAAGVAALGAAGLAIAQEHHGGRGERHDLFEADTNNDGAVTRAEFDTAHAARFATADADDDGQLARDEMHREHGGRGGRGGHGDHGMHLASADANNDGNITRDEFLARPTEHFAQLDTNSDGVISTSERPQPRERGERGERRGAGERGERVNPDTNGDHQLSRDEFAAMGATMFQRIDANNDGRITREEAEAGHRGHPRGGVHN